MDFWNETCYVSLVGFMFLDTKLLGFPIPFHRNFEEVNLRFYVRYNDNGEWKRGVVFIKEIVPKPMLSFVAYVIYKEHYQTMKMDHAWIEGESDRTIKYSWYMNDVENSFSIRSSLKPFKTEIGSEEEFITEHYWGNTKANENSSFEYEVTHPRWGCYDVLDKQLNVDFELIYGNDFSELSNQEPLSVMLAEGSEISVENKRKI